MDRPASRGQLWAVSAPITHSGDRTVKTTPRRSAPRSDTAVTGVSHGGRCGESRRCEIGNDALSLRGYERGRSVRPVVRNIARVNALDASSRSVARSSARERIVCRSCSDFASSSASTRARRRSCHASYSSHNASDTHHTTKAVLATRRTTPATVAIAATASITAPERCAGPRRWRIRR